MREDEVDENGAKACWSAAFVAAIKDRSPRLGLAFFPVCMCWRPQGVDPTARRQARFTAIVLRRLPKDAKTTRYAGDRSPRAASKPNWLLAHMQSGKRNRIRAEARIAFGASLRND
jgi:hypothetical protein